MHSYINGLVEFAAIHPNAVGSLAFLSALLESLVVVGAVVPGSTILVALGALVPARAADVWLLTALACAGAVAGDWLSYWVGRRYHGRIRGWWPFHQHPLLLGRGETFFRSRGAKSVFVARFVPGARAVVPLVAGMTAMPAARFCTVNAAAALIWGPIHILPGVLLGASIEILGAAAGRLALLAVLVCAVLWLAGRLASIMFLWGLPQVERSQRCVWLWATARDTGFRRCLRWLLDSDWRAVTFATAGIALPVIVLWQVDLGPHWSSGLLAGLVFALAWLAMLALVHNRFRPHQRPPRMLGLVFVLALVATAGFHVVRDHAPGPMPDIESPMTVAGWWAQGWRDLPDRRQNLIAQFEEPFIVQWAGDLGTLQRQLETAGWHAAAPWDLAGILAWFGNYPSPADLPVVPKLDAGQAPVLNLVRLTPDAADASRWVLRLWPTSRVLATDGTDQVPLWLGAVSLEKLEQIPFLFTLAREQAGGADPLQPVMEALAAGQAMFRLERRDEAAGSRTQLLGHGPGLAVGHDSPQVALAVPIDR